MSIYPLRCSRRLIFRFIPSLQRDFSESAQCLKNSQENLRSMILLGPAVRNLLEYYKIASRDVQGSGPRGFVLKGDVLKFIREQNLRPTSFTIPKVKDTIELSRPAAASKPIPKDNKGKVKYIDIPLGEYEEKAALRSVVGKNSIPHSYLYANCTVDQALKFLEGMEGINLTHFFVRAAVGAIQRVPLTGSINASKECCLDVERYIDGNKMQSRRLKKADSMGMKDIAATLEKIGLPELESENITNVSFKIVSLIGSRMDQITPILAPSQLWALSLGDIMTKVESDSKAPSKVVSLTLSYDARKISDAEAGFFMEQIKSFIERPAMLLITGNTLKR